MVAGIAAGYGAELVIGGIADPARADDIRRGIYRCAQHRGVSADAGPAGRTVGAGEMGIVKTGRTYALHYRIWEKRTARKRHLDTHGADRAAWPYDPRRTASAAERESWANRNESGEPVKHN